jgi:hypothetical protein
MLSPSVWWPVHRTFNLSLRTSFAFICTLNVRTNISNPGSTAIVIEYTKTMSAGDLQAFLRFLSQDCKVPLALAMGKVKELQAAKLDSPEKIAKAKLDDIKPIFPDEKVAKQVLAAGKRISKKRAAGGDVDSGPSPAKKKRKDENLLGKDEATPAELEASLALPSCVDSAEDLQGVVLFTNRAPLALAFVFTLLRFTMPNQPLSSRLSLAQGYIGVTSKARALYLGIDKGRSAEEEGFGEGQPSVWITGKEVKVLRRWGYEWRESEDSTANEQSGGFENDKQEPDADAEPPLWALDLEALKKSNTLGSVPALGKANVEGSTNLPIHTPQAARTYLLKAFDTPPAASKETSKKSSAATKATEKERNLGMLLRALELLYESWSPSLTPDELDKRTWSWYVRVRPDVADGAAGWGGKNTVKVADILALRKQVDGV